MRRPFLLIGIIIFLFITVISPEMASASFSKENSDAVLDSLDQAIQKRDEQRRYEERRDEQRRYEEQRDEETRRYEEQHNDQS